MEVLPVPATLGLVGTVTAISIGPVSLPPVALPPVALPPKASSPCPNTTIPAVNLTAPQFEESLFCLTNRRRVGGHLVGLKPNGLLHRAAARYAHSLIVGQFFSHHGDLAGHRSASNVVGRLQQVGYVRPGWQWMVGENLRWAPAEASSPGAIFQAWMDSPVHREHILRPGYRELGIGTEMGTPIAPTIPSGVTVVSEFGFRR